MKTIRLFFSLFILITHGELLAQDYDKVYFNSNWIVTSIDSAIYYRSSDFNTTLPSYEGKVTDYFLKTNQIEMTGSYNDGKKDGEFNFYYSNGQIKKVANFVNNNRIGTWKEFYRNGIVKIEVYYDGEKEKILALNDSLGNSIIKKNSFKYSMLRFRVPAFLVEKNASLKTEHITVKGKVLQNLRDGKWSIKKDGKLFASLKYKNGILTKGYYILNKEKLPLVNNLAFPLIEDPVKFYMTESFALAPGAVIKNNYVTEGLHQNKFKSMEKVKITNHEDLLSYVHDNFVLRSKLTTEKIKINLKIKNGRIESFTTKPKISSGIEKDLNLLFDTIENISFNKTDMITIEYTVKSGKDDW